MSLSDSISQDNSIHRRPAQINIHLSCSKEIYKH